MKTKEFESTNKSGDKIAVVFKRPTQAVLSRGDFVYRAEFSKAIRAGIMTSAEANKLLKERGIWDEEREDEEAKLRLEISDLPEKLGRVRNQDEFYRTPIYPLNPLKSFLRFSPR